MLLIDQGLLNILSRTAKYIIIPDHYKDYGVFCKLKAPCIVLMNFLKNIFSRLLAGNMAESAVLDINITALTWVQVTLN